MSDDNLAAISCLGRIQTLIRTESFEIIDPVQSSGDEKPYPNQWHVSV